MEEVSKSKKKTKNQDLLFLVPEGSLKEPGKKIISIIMT